MPHRVKCLPYVEVEHVRVLPLLGPPPNDLAEHVDVVNAAAALPEATLALV